MKKKLFGIGLLTLLLALFIGCNVVGGIFKAGVWAGVFIVLLFIALIIYIIYRASKKN